MNKDLITELGKYELKLITELGEYELKLITRDHLYYLKIDEDDENNSVIMKDKDGNLISENYFAYCDFIEQLEGIIEGLGNYEYIDSETLEQAKKYLVIDK